MDAYVQCSRNKVGGRSFKLNLPYALYRHGKVQEKHYALLDLPVHGEQIEPSPIFIANFSHEL